MATITVNGVRLAYDEAGAGPPVVWVHGGFTGRRGADLVAPLLAERYRVITYDRRGHSQSERVPGHQGVTAQVTDLAALIEHLDAAPAHLLANSDGGEIALKLAVRRPELVASLCLNEPSLHGILPDDPEIKQAMEDLQARLDRMIAELEQGNHEAAARLDRDRCDGDGCLGRAARAEPAGVHPQRTHLARHRPRPDLWHPRHPPTGRNHRTGAGDRGRAQRPGGPRSIGWVRAAYRQVPDVLRGLRLGDQPRRRDLQGGPALGASVLRP